MWRKVKARYRYLALLLFFCNCGYIALRKQHEEKILEPLVTDTPQAKDKALVIIFSYERSGSSIVGEFINRNEKAFYLFEPLFGLYSHLYGELWGRPSTIYFNYKKSSTARYAPQYEIEAITETLHNLLSCKLERLPVEALPSFFSLKYNKEISLSDFKTCFISQTQHLDKQKNRFFPNDCKKNIIKDCRSIFDNHTEYNCFNSVRQFPSWLNQITHFKHTLNVSSNLNSYTSSFENSFKRFQSHNKCIDKAAQHAKNCLPKAIQNCVTADIIGTKIIRARMQDLKHLLIRLPNLKIVHVVRDPRGISNSRLNRYQTKAERLQDIKHTCDKILEDIIARENLENTFANNFFVLPYEQLATNPMDNVAKFYKFINMPLSDGMKQFVWSSTHNVSAKEHPLGTSRKNSKQVAYSWMNANNTVINKKIEVLCRDVMMRLNYL